MNNPIHDIKGHSNKRRILVVEDDIFTADIYKIELSNRGFEVIVAGNGLDGLEMAKQHQPELIILDMIMPVMDGFETLSRIKKDPNLSSQKILVISNLEQQEDIKRARDLGADDYMIKLETDIIEIMAKIHQLLR